jgi:F0F1-type ATP synthase assembly protein I
MTKNTRKTTMTMMSEAMREMLPYTNLGWQLAATMGLFFGAGYLLDGWLDTGSLLTIILAVLGIIVGLYTVITTANKLQEKRKPPSP